MKLLHRTLIYFLIISIPTFMLGSIAFYYFLKFAIIRQVDDSLIEDKKEIISFVNNNKNDITELYKAISCTYYLKPAKQAEFSSDKFSFVFEFDSTDMEDKPFRQLKTNINIQQKKYELYMRESFVDRDSLIYSILFFATVLIGLLTVGITLINWYISKKIWNPFYKILNILSSYRPDKGTKITLSSGDIKEFKILIETLQKMIKRIDKDFNRQKKFIDNIAHELQTPLSIASSQLELIIQDSNLNDETSELILNLDNTLLKLKNINQTLLLLSRIQNDQFSDITKIQISKLINDYLNSHIDQIDMLNIDLKVKVTEKFLVEMNESLATILIGNLLSNAIKHNIYSGFIHISMINSRLIIENSGEKLEIDSQHLFNSYVKGKTSLNSTGIGLSIVKEICNTCNFQVSYINEDTKHSITILFNNSNALDSL